MRGGHADGGIFRKQIYIEQLARDYRIPLIMLLDGSRFISYLPADEGSGGGSVTSMLKMEYSYVPPLFGFDNKVLHFILN